MFRPLLMSSRWLKRLLVEPVALSHPRDKEPVVSTIQRKQALTNRHRGLRHLNQDGATHPVTPQRFPAHSRAVGGPAKRTKAKVGLTSVSFASIAW